MPFAICQKHRADMTTHSPSRRVEFVLWLVCTGAGCVSCCRDVNKSIYGDTAATPANVFNRKNIASERASERAAAALCFAAVALQRHRAPPAARTNCAFAYIVVYMHNSNSQMGHMRVVCAHATQTTHTNTPND